MRVGRDPWSPLRRRVKNAVLLAEPWRFTSIELERFATARRWYPRGALVAGITSGADVVWAVAVHFGLDGAERSAQAASLMDLARTLDGGLVIVGGDLNATPDMRAVVRIAGDLRDAWSHAGQGDGATFPAFAPVARIDYVFVGQARDHRPAIVGAEGLDGCVGPSAGGRRSATGGRRAEPVAQRRVRGAGSGCGRAGPPRRARTRSPRAPGTSACSRRTTRGSPTGPQCSTSRRVASTGASYRTARSGAPERRTAGSSSGVAPARWVEVGDGYAFDPWRHRWTTRKTTAQEQADEEARKKAAAVEAYESEWYEVLEAAGRRTRGSRRDRGRGRLSPRPDVTGP